MHSLTYPHAEAGRGSRGRGPCASRDDAPCSRRANTAGHNGTSRDGGLPSSASHGVTQQSGSCHGLDAASAASNIAPVAVDAVKLDEYRNVHLYSVLDAAALRAAH